MNHLEVNIPESYTISVGFPKNSETEHGNKQWEYAKMKEYHKNSPLDGKAYEEIVDIRKKLGDKLLYPDKNFIIYFSSSLRKRIIKK